MGWGWVPRPLKSPVRSQTLEGLIRDRRVPIPIPPTPFWPSAELEVQASPAALCHPPNSDLRSVCFLFVQSSQFSGMENARPQGLPGRSVKGRDMAWGAQRGRGAGLLHGCTVTSACLVLAEVKFAFSSYSGSAWAN